MPKYLLRNLEKSIGTQEKCVARKKIIEEVSLHYKKAEIKIKSNRCIANEIDTQTACQLLSVEKKYPQNIVENLGSDETLILWPRNLISEIRRNHLKLKKSASNKIWLFKLYAYRQSGNVLWKVSYTS